MTTDLDDLRIALLELTPAQQLAVEALAVGDTHEVAAVKAGVTRETVTRWSGHVPSFQAATNRFRSALAHEQIDTARRIRGKALKAVETALDESRIDPLTVLRVVNDVSSSIGSTLPEEILDAEMNKTRIGLPPTPPPRGMDAIMDSLSDPGPSDIERAEEATLTRLAAAGRVKGKWKQGCA